MNGYSRYYLMEQVWFKLEAGYPDVVNAIQQEDIIAAIGQKVNEMLKLQYFSVTLPSAETIPENLFIATYNNIPLTTFHGKRSKATLPVMPVALPRNMGIFEVDRYEDFRCPFIPLQAGQYALLKSQPLISELLGQVGYEVYGNSVILTQDLTIDQVTEIHMRLIVNDINNYSDTDILPIPADYASEIIKQVFESFAPVQQVEAVKDSLPKQISK